MNPSDTEFDPPCESEVAAASLTMAPARQNFLPVRERLAAAFAFLESLPNPPTEASLVFARGRKAPFEVVPIGAGLAVGRGDESSLCLPEGASLSRRHFSVQPKSGMWLLEDLKSRNGTEVDGVPGRVGHRLLRDGDIIFAGEMMFLFVNPAA